jgi:ABC-type transport system involved in multi-copper enzyme maturation permease subunit
MATDTNQSEETTPHRSLRSHWFLLLLAIAGIIALSAWLGAFEISILVGLVALGVLLLGYGREGWAPGPLYYFDVLRLARKGRGTVIRCVYGVALLVGLCLLFANECSPGELLTFSSEHGPRMTLPEMARFAERFMLVVVSLQSVAVILLTPAYLAGAIAEEKEAKTLELLFTTHLSNRQIVIGKMLARLTHLVGVLLTGLPILSLTQLFGGVSAELLVCHFLVAGLTLLSVGSLCILCSVQSKTVLGAMIASYTVVIGLSLGCMCPPCFFFASPFGFGRAYDAGIFSGAAWLGSATHSYLFLLIPYVLVHGGLAWFFLIPAVREVRRRAGVDSVSGRPKEEPKPPAAVLVVPVEHFERPSEKTDPPPKKPNIGLILEGKAPPVSDHPLLWKEMHHGVSGMGMQMATSILGVSFLAFMVWVGISFLVDLATGIRAYVNVLNPGLRVIVCVLCTVLTLGAGLHTASCIVRERAQRTLLNLLLLPIERWELLGAKWLGSILRLRYTAYFLIIMLIAGTLTGAFHPIAVALIILTVAVHVAFAATLGLLISVYCRTMLAANFVMALFLFVWFAGTAIILAGMMPAMGPGYSVSFVDNIIDASINPCRTYWLASFSYDREHRALTLDLQAFCVLCGLPVYAGFGYLMWVLSCVLLGGTRAKRRAAPGS